MKKKSGILVVIILLSVVILVGSIFFKGLNIFSNNEKELTDINKIQKIITETHKTDVVILGDDIAFSTDVPSRRIETLSAKELEQRANCKYTILIINDLSGSVELSAESQEFLAKCISEDAFCLIYLGEKYSNIWDDPTELIATIEGNLFFMYYSVNGEIYRNVGSWKVQDQEQAEKYPYSLGETLMYSFEYYLQSVN